MDSLGQTLGYELLQSQVVQRRPPEQVGCLLGSTPVREALVLCRFVFVVLMPFMAPSWAFAQDEASTHAAMRKSLAYIEVSGQKPNGVPLQSSGTGVLMDEIGHVLTVFHLVDQVAKEALDNAFDVTVRIGDRNGPARPATVIRRYPDRDVLVLRIQTATEPYQPACFGSDRPPLSRLGDAFLTSGFPLDLGYFTDSGKVTTTDGPLGLFGIDIPISSGQSGSPVYNTEGRVLGLMVGSLEGEGIAGQHYYRPLRFIWDVVLSFGQDDCETGRIDTLNRQNTTSADAYGIASDMWLIGRPGEAGSIFRDFQDAPRMTVIPRGDFSIGSPPGEHGRSGNEGPQQEVVLDRVYALSQAEVTLGEWRNFVEQTGHPTGQDCRVKIKGSNVG